MFVNGKRKRPGRSRRLNMTLKRRNVLVSVVQKKNIEKCTREGEGILQRSRRKGVVVGSQPKSRHSKRKK